MQRDVDALVLTTINQCHRTPITVGILLDLLQQTRAPGPWTPHVAQFFSDVPIGAMRRFCDAHAMAQGTVRKYYEAHIRAMGDHNPDFERWVYGDVGATV